MFRLGFQKHALQYRMFSELRLLFQLYSNKVDMLRAVCLHVHQKNTAITFVSMVCDYVLIM